VSSPCLLCLLWLRSSQFPCDFATSSGLKKYVITSFNEKDCQLAEDVLSKCRAMMKKHAHSQRHTALLKIAAKAVGKYELAQFIREHSKQLDGTTAAGSDKTPSATLLQTLLEQKMNSLEDAKNFMAVDTLAALGVPSTTASLFFSKIS